ncbi:hypothetical protein C451_03709 [Halococcus thailandensis JCM 13552]|uniref:Uncharacterized protein n=1 Tax=Halococcus thailandensis JCM 13552 TaxID=1227457 RepID=M0NGD5_9EURY|nr:hypothetical protein C451_03709 [Halococcus thailandensis JCM 13552]
MEGKIPALSIHTGVVHRQHVLEGQNEPQQGPNEPIKDQDSNGELFPVHPTSRIDTAHPIDGVFDRREHPIQPLEPLKMARQAKIAVRLVAIDPCEVLADYIDEWDEYGEKHHILDERAWVCHRSEPRRIQHHVREVREHGEREDT